MTRTISLVTIFKELTDNLVRKRIQRQSIILLLSGRSTQVRVPSTGCMGARQVSLPRLLASTPGFDSWPRLRTTPTLFQGRNIHTARSVGLSRRLRRRLRRPLHRPAIFAILAVLSAIPVHAVFAADFLSRFNKHRLSTVSSCPAMKKES
jgi:hypothetical protein